jgi:Dehydrogenases with different specificities (related to short-chain alcohol dehydrogenases)
MASLSGRIALVTGASRGIGYQTALALASEGAHVIALARTVGGLEELDDEIKRRGGEATLVPLDLTDMPAIDRLGGAIHERWGRLDILVANAAMLGTISPLAHVEAKVFDKLIALNVTSTWRLIRSVEPLLLKSDAGRAVVLTSGVAQAPRAFWGPYAASKAAVETMVRVWAEETSKTKLRVNSADPGATRTAMRAQAYPGEDPDTLPKPVDVAGKLVALCTPDVTVSGKLYRVRDGAFYDYAAPVPLA